MEQFNPCLRNFIAMAKSYEKALNSEYSRRRRLFVLLTHRCLCFRLK